MEISVILPAYNERENIHTAVIRTHKYLKNRFKSYEIVVVDDGGTDGTREQVLKLRKKYKFIRIISHDKNMGYGRTLRTGFSNAKGKLIFYTDSDNQYDITEMDKLLPILEYCDIVSGYRLNHEDPLTRIIISNVYNMIISLLLNLSIKDVDCSFKLYKRKVFENMELKSQTGLIDAEVLVKALKSGFNICQVGVNHYPRLKGKTIYEIGGRNKIFAFVDPRVPFRIFAEIFRLWPELH